MEIQKLKDIELDFIRYKILFLRLQNKSVYEILKNKEIKQFNLTKEEVETIIKDSSKRLNKDSETINEFTKLRELMKTELIEKEAWEVFNKSKEGTIQTIHRETDKGFEKIEKHTSNTENIKALEVILDCIKERNRVLGNIAPIKAEHSGAIELKELKINYIVPEEIEE